MNNKNFSKKNQILSTYLMSLDNLKQKIEGKLPCVKYKSHILKPEDIDPIVSKTEFNKLVENGLKDVSIDNNWDTERREKERDTISQFIRSFVDVKEDNEVIKTRLLIKMIR